MIHFPAEQWFEFARNLESSEQQLLMQHHLDEGCESCQEILAMWREVLEIGARDSRYRPPAGMVRIAKAAFVPTERWKYFPSIAEAALVIFDSMLGPAPAATRGSGIATRQLVQEVKPFVVDLRLEHEATKDRVRLVGQVLNSAEPQRSVSDVEIFLLTGERLTANALANSSGEFELEFKNGDNLQLFVDIRGRKVIEIQLPDLRR